MNEHIMRFRIGIFVLASLLLLAVLVMLFGRVPVLFHGPVQRYYIEFDNAPGVAVNTPVRRSGVRIGQVEKVELDDATGKVLVTIVIDAPHVLYQDDRPQLVHGALSGDTSIDFVSPSDAANSSKQHSERTKDPPLEIQQVVWQPGQQDQGAQLTPQPPGARTPAQPGTVFKGTSQADVAGMLNELQKLTPPARDAFAEMRKTLESYDKMTPLMQETLREIRDLAKTSREVIPELRRTNDEIQVTSRNWGKLSERLDVLLQTNQDKLVKALDNFNESMVRIANIFNEENQRNLAVALRNVSAGTKNLESISQRTEDLVKQTQTTVSRIGDSITQADQILQNLQQTTRPMAERSATIMRNLDESTEKLNHAMSDVRALLRAINEGDGTLKRFLTDPALYENLNAAACMLARTMPRLDRILKDVGVFADKIARHPESLGIGGVVNPSKGLKDAPTSTSFR